MKRGIFPKTLAFYTKKMYIYNVFKVSYKKKVDNAVKNMPKAHSIRFRKLVRDLEQKGPVQPEWPNYSILKGTNTHHCHLSHSWVACWVETLQGIEIEVTYAGSRESAPYA
jgi:hypothetical protein